MNILFIFPLNEPYDTIVNAGKTPWMSKLSKNKNIKKIDCVYPTGLLSIAAYAKKYVPDINVKILDFNVIMNQKAEKSLEGYSQEDFLNDALDVVNDFNPDVIGVSTLFCSNYKDLGGIFSCLKKSYPDSFTFCGGHLISAIYKRVYEDDLLIDAISFGEGEIPFVELLNAIKSDERDKYLASSPSWITKEKLEFDPDFVPKRKLITDLDEIPRYDFDMLLFNEAYFNSTNYFFVINTQEEQREMFIFSTRGCPHHCVFCASQNVHGHKIRSYSVERIKSDILHFNKKYNITRFVFYDDHFLSKKKRAIEILNFIAENNFTAEIPTPAFFSINQEVANAMRRAGIKEVNITIESGNEDTLKNIMHKPANLKKAEEAIEHLHNNGITVISNIPIGLPGETHESIDKGLEYLKTTNINWFQCFVTAPLPGSDLYALCEKNKYFANNGDILNMDFKKCVIKTPEFIPEYIEKKAYEMNLTLNFVNNYDMRMGNYDKALKLFERIFSSVIDTHAFAYYFAAECCHILSIDDKYQIYKNKYIEMTEKYSFWKEWDDYFNLKALE